MGIMLHRRIQPDQSAGLTCSWRFSWLPAAVDPGWQREILLDDSILLTEKAKSAGVDVTLKIRDGMWHVWQALGDLIPENKKTFEEIGEFVQGQFGRIEKN